MEEATYSNILMVGNINQREFVNQGEKCRQQDQNK